MYINIYSTTCVGLIASSDILKGDVESGEIRVESSTEQLMKHHRACTLGVG